MSTDAVWLRRYDSPSSWPTEKWAKATGRTIGETVWLKDFVGTTNSQVLLASQRETWDQNTPRC
jgi:hypothetical protein